MNESRTLHIAFWNVENLFPVGSVDRGPSSDEELEDKLHVLGDVIKSFFESKGPDLFGCAEVANLGLLEMLSWRLGGEYLSPLWWDASRQDQTGIGLLGKRSTIRKLSPLNVQKPSIGARPRSALAECWIVGVEEPLIVAVNHWKSRLVSAGGNQAENEADRLETANWLAAELQELDRTAPVVAVGDFNAEPFEAPFNKGDLKAGRTFSSATHSRANPSCLYNTAWRFLTEPVYIEETRDEGFKEPRPKDSHDGSDSLFDQILVSGGCLRKGPIRIRERTVRFHLDDRTREWVEGTGRMKPRRWSYLGSGDHSGSSDHFPLLAEFDILKEG